MYVAICLDETVASGQYSLVIEVIKEDAPQPPPLPPVLDEEVLVAPALELGVVGGVVAVAYLHA